MITRKYHSERFHKCNTCKCWKIRTAAAAFMLPDGAFGWVQEDKNFFDTRQVEPGKFNTVQLHIPVTEF